MSGLSDIAERTTINSDVPQRYRELLARDEAQQTERGSAP
jgi:hypothetical protein